MTTANILNITVQLCFFGTLPCHPEHAGPNESTVSPACLTTVDVQSAFRICPRTAAPVSSTLGHAMAVPFWGCTVTPKRPKLVSPPEPLAAFGSIWTCRKTWARKPISFAPILVWKYHTKIYPTFFLYNRVDSGDNHQSEENIVTRQILCQHLFQGGWVGKTATVLFQTPLSSWIISSPSPSPSGIVLR